MSSTPRQKKYRERLRKAAVDILGGVCIRCGFSDIRALQIDHINGGGHAERKIVNKKSGRQHYYKQVVDSVLNNENKYQLLCANCNWIKRFENNENRRPF